MKLGSPLLYFSVMLLYYNLFSCRHTNIKMDQYTKCMSRVAVIGEGHSGSSVDFRSLNVFVSVLGFL